MRLYAAPCRTMKRSKTRYRVVIDGPGFGVEEYMSRYGYVLINDEPFPTRKEAVIYMADLYDDVDPEYDFRAARHAWQHGKAGLGE